MEKEGAKIQKISKQQRAKRQVVGEEGVEGEPMKIGGRGGVTEPSKKWAFHLGSVHNVLNVLHKGRCHAFSSERGQINRGVPLQQLVHQT